MKTIHETAGMFGISQLGVWKLIRTHGMKTSLDYRLGKPVILVDFHQIERYFQKHPEILEQLRCLPK